PFLGCSLPSSEKSKQLPQGLWALGHLLSLGAMEPRPRHLLWPSPGLTCPTFARSRIARLSTIGLGHLLPRSHSPRSSAMACSPHPRQLASTQAYWHR